MYREQRWDTEPTEVSLPTWQRRSCAGTLPRPHASLPNDSACLPACLRSKRETMQPGVLLSGDAGILDCMEYYHSQGVEACFTPT